MEGKHNWPEITDRAREYIDAETLASLEGPEGFIKFLTMAWEQAGTPAPTALKQDMARFLVEGGPKIIIQGYRGVSKSFIASVWVVWMLLLNPELQIMVVSASSTRAEKFTTFVLQVIERAKGLCDHLKPKRDGRRGRSMFDVGCCTVKQSTSVFSVGLAGQATGDRADIVIADDVETRENSMTVRAREEILASVAEFTDIVSASRWPKIVYLGTPQVEDTVYNTLRLDRGYTTMVWPARVPTMDQANSYGGTLAPFVWKLMETEDAGDPTDPGHMTQAILMDKELEGLARFQMQYMLDPTLSSVGRYPLRLSDLSLLDFDDLVPEEVIYSSDKRNIITDVDGLGIADEPFYAPGRLLGSWMKPEKSVIAIDPSSGKQKDEHAFSVMGALGGHFFGYAVGAIPEPYSDDGLAHLADLVKRHKPHCIVYEENYGGDQYKHAINRYFRKHKIACGVETIRSSKQKELRICDTLEPLFLQHRLTLNKAIFSLEDATLSHIGEVSARRDYRLSYQISRMTRARGALVHDDRIDAMAIAVAFLDASSQIASEDRIMREEEELEEFYALFPDDADEFHANYAE